MTRDAKVGTNSELAGGGVDRNWWTRPGVDRKIPEGATRHPRGSVSIGKLGQLAEWLI